MGKQADYAGLVQTRQACRLCEELINPATCPGGITDSDVLGPWSRWQGNLDAELLVVGQDWGDDRYYIKHEGHDDPRTPTNRNLVSLVDSIGIRISPPTKFDLGGGTIFLTNAILCLKKDGGLEGAVTQSWFKNCSGRFLRRVIEVVRPRVVITLGSWACWSVQLAHGLAPIPLRAAVAAAQGFELSKGTRFFPMYHCGQRVLNTRIRTREQQLADWERVKRWRALPGNQE